MWHREPPESISFSFWLSIMRLINLFSGVILFGIQNELLTKSINQKVTFNDYGEKEELFNISEPIFRAKRAADFNEIHTKLTMAARIFSGISMRIGIYDGSLTADQLISELLNLKSVKPDDVAKFDKAKVDGFFTSLAGLNVGVTPDLKKLEDKISAMNLLREKYEKIENPDDVASIKEYMDKVKAFAGAGAETDFLNNIGSTHIPTVVGILDNFKKQKYSALMASDVQGLKSRLDVIANLTDKIESFMTIINSHEELTNNKILESTTVQSVDLIKKFFQVVESLRATSTATAIEFVSFLGSISQLSADFDAILPFLEIIKQVGKIQSRNEHPSGFINGFSDVIELKTDVKNTWLSTVIQNYDSDLVKSELKPLEKFNASFVALKEKWKSLTDPKVLETITSLTNTFKQSQATIDQTVIMGLDGKDAPNKPVDFVSKMKTLVNDVLKLRDTLMFMKSTFARMVGSLQRLKNQLEFRSLLDTSNGRTIQTVVDEVLQAQNITAVIKSLKELQPEFVKIEGELTGDPLKALPAAIEPLRPEIDVFVGDDIKKTHFEYFDFLKTLKSQLESLSGCVHLIRTIREIKSDTNLNASLIEITDKISGSIQDFKALRAVPDAIKSTNTERIGELIQMKKIQTDSKGFGEAVAVLDTVKSILSKKTDIEDLLDKGWDIDKAIKSSTDPSINKDQLQEYWRSFGDFSIYLDSLLTTLETKTASMGSANRLRRQLTTLEDYVNKLDTLKDLPDSKTDLKPMMEVLEKLSAVPSSPTMLSTLKSLDKLDLKFSSHQSAITGLGTVVTGLLGLFGQKSQTSIKPAEPSGTGETSEAPGPGGPRRGPPKPHGSSSGNQSSSESSEITGEYVAKVIFFVIAIAGSIFVAMFLVYCFLLREKEPEKSPEVKPVPHDLPKVIAELSTKTAKEKSKLAKIIEEMPPENSEKMREDTEKLKDCYQQRIELNRKRAPIGKKLFDELTTLEKQLKKVKKNVEKVARLEYERNELLLKSAMVQLEANKNYEEEDTVNKQIRKFEVMKLTPLQMCRDKPTWRNAEGRYMHIPRSAEFVQYVVTQFTEFTTNKACLEHNRSATMILCPYKARLDAVNDEVGKKKYTFDTMKELPHPTKTWVQCFDATRVILKSGVYINATEFITAYGTKIYVAASPGEFNTRENINLFLFEVEPMYTLSVGLDGIDLFDNHHQTVRDQFWYRKSAMAYVMLTKDPDPNEKFPELDPMLTRQDITINEMCSTRSHRLTHYDLIGIKDKESRITKNPRFRQSIFMFLFEAARHINRSMVFFDDHGGQWAGTIAGIELISTWLSTDGIVAADVTTQLLRLLERRGLMFTMPDQVMFMIYMAVQRFGRDNLVEVNLDWTRLETACSLLTDRKMKTERFGEEYAKKMGVKEEDRTIGTDMPVFEEKPVPKPVPKPEKLPEKEKIKTVEEAKPKTGKPPIPVIPEKIKTLEEPKPEKIPIPEKIKTVEELKPEPLPVDRTQSDHDSL